MRTFVTEIIAVRPKDGVLVRYCGPHVPGISFQHAQEYCEQNGLGYCKVIGELIEETPCKSGTFEPDFSKKVNYENLN